MLPANPLLTAPDDGYNPAFINAWTTDLGEIASRLGSIDTLRRTGKVVFFDEFAVMSWTKLGIIGTFNIVATPAIRYWGSLKMTPGSGPGFFAEAFRNFPNLRNTRVGLEIQYMSNASVSTELFQIVITKGVGNNTYQGGLQVKPFSGIISYMDHNGVFQNGIIPGVQIPTGTWQNFKVVFDFGVSPGQTVAIYQNQDSLILSENLFLLAAGPSPFVTVQINQIDTSGAFNYVNVEDFIMTVDEP